MRLYQGFIELLLLVSCTALTRKGRQQGWHCSGRVTEYTNRYCGDQGPIEGCYFVDDFDQYRSCGVLCNNIIASSTDEENCNAECTGFLVRYCTLDWLHTSSPPTTTVASMDPSTTFTNSHGAPVADAANSEPKSNQRRIILLTDRNQRRTVLPSDSNPRSKVWLAVMSTLGFFLVVGVWRYRKRRPARRENGSVDHSANTETIALNGSPPTSRTPPLLSQDEGSGTSSDLEQETRSHLKYTTSILLPPEDDERLAKIKQ